MKALTLISSLVLSAITLTTSAQMMRSSGYVILNNGDTLCGWIDYKGWTENPRQIIFRTDSLSKQKMIYTVSDIAYFEIPGEDIYVRTVVTKDLRPISTDYAWPAGMDSSVTDTVFLRLLVKGSRLNLYELNDDRPYYYVQEGNGACEELEYKVYAGNSNVYRYSYAYRDKLLLYAHKWGTAESLNDIIQNAPYSAEDLTRIIAKLNKAGTGQLTYTVSSHSRHFSSWFVGLGGGVASTKFKGNLNFVDPSSAAGVFFLMGGVDVPMSSRNLNALMLRIDMQLSFTRYEQVVAYTTVANSSSSVTYYTYYNFNQTNLAPGLSVLYYFMQHKSFKMFAGGGAGFNFSFYNNKEVATGSSAAVPLSLASSWLFFNLRGGVRLGDNVEIGGQAKLLGNFIDNYKSNLFLLNVSFRIK